ncbi:uncharacterized protein JCM15063_000162 [Sporobolomyces koalae]|uniref:uncharacterized protein n=1 Tax=Sporobolomyces koalae TaxID=500713 RepID=UPI0031784BB5
MAKLATQPETAVTIPLRSGFFALPFNQGQSHLFARIHHQQQLADDEDENLEDEAGQGSANQLFVTGVPLGMTEKGLKQTLAKVFEPTKVKQVSFLPSSNASQGVLSLLTKEVTAAKHAVAFQGITVSPLFDDSSSSTSTSAPASASSAIVTFSSAPALPPPAYPATTTLVIAVQPSFLSTSAQRHALARPHRSTVIAHVDTWMNAYDARKLAAAPASYSADVAIAQREQLEQAANKKNKKGKKGKTTDVGPLPGSAAEALARHAEEQRKRFDQDHNPDEVQDGEWTLVTGGGKHGKSLLPTGISPTVDGYGGVTVKVAKKKRGKSTPLEEEANDQGIKKIVGDGFYRFNKADSRRKSLATLRSKFEEDKARVDRMRSGPGGRGRGRGRGGFSSRGRGGGGGREGRSYKPY